MRIRFFFYNCLIGVKCAVAEQDEKVKPRNKVKVTPQTESFWKATHFISFMEPGVATKVTSSGFICAVLNVKHPGGVSVSSARSALFPECNLCGEKMMPLTAIVCNSAIPLLRCAFLSRPLSSSASLISSPYLESWSRRGFIVSQKEYGEIGCGKDSVLYFHFTTWVLLSSSDDLPAGSPSMCE